MKKFLIITFILFFFIAAGGAAFFLMTDRLMFQNPALFSRNPKLTYVIGDVRYQTPDSDEWTTAVNGDSLPEGTVLSTGDHSKTDIKFSNEMVIRLSPNSKLVLSTATIRRKIIRLEEGSMYGHFKREFQDQSIKVVTPTAVAGVRGTELGFELMETPQTDPNENAQDTDSDNKVPATAVYAISGIVEVENASLKDSNMLLSFQTMTMIGGNL
ncbi:MAG: FecR domain-containing protein, partial [Spirochaetia bacterium]|nr:FecR domain-containing protein [Spirochaetia bacterium]